MRTSWGFVVLALMIATAVEVGSVTVSPDPSTFQQMGADVQSFGYSQIRISATVSLPANEYLIRLAPTESANMVTYSSLDSVSLGMLPAGASRGDLPTSSDDSYARIISDLGANDCLGLRPLFVLGEKMINLERYARIMLFPVTVDVAGNRYVHESITIQVGTRKVANSDLLPIDSVNAENERHSISSVSLGSLPYSENYVIITNSALVDSFRPLAQYKRQTGYQVSLMLMEDIRAHYTGRDDAERLREYLKVFHSQGGRYVLLGGDQTVVPIRYTYHLNSDTAIYPGNEQVCDLYFADLTGDWNRDNDLVWGERTQDAADFSPELYVGRLPVNTPQDVSNYVQKLIAYETNPGGGDPSYLNRAFFFSTDQMRDYTPTTQHAYIASAYPTTMEIDSTHGVEALRGDDPAPSNTAARDLGPLITQGFGIINVLAHGRDDGFAAKTAGYNSGTISWLWTNPASGESNMFAELEVREKPAFYYSLACENAAYDKSSAPFNYTNRNMTRELIGERGGAVGMVANSRWGWVGTSYILQRCFFDSLFAHPDRPAVAAMYAAKSKYSYYRDLVMGQNFFGDPTLKIYTKTPALLQVSSVAQGDSIVVTVASNGTPEPNCRVLLSDTTGVIAEVVTAADGRAVAGELDLTKPIYISALHDGTTIGQAFHFPSIVLGVNDDHSSKPTSYSLDQNYPNPFNPSTQIAFSLAKPGHVTLTIFDLLGREVTTLVDRVMPAGEHSQSWSGRSGSGATVASGIYMYRLSAGTFAETRKMMLLK